MSKTKSKKKPAAKAAQNNAKPEPVWHGYAPVLEEGKFATRNDRPSSVGAIPDLSVEEMYSKDRPVVLITREHFDRLNSMQETEPRQPEARPGYPQAVVTLHGTIGDEETMKRALQTAREALRGYYVDFQIIMHPPGHCEPQDGQPKPKRKPDPFVTFQEAMTAIQEATGGTFEVKFTQPPPAAGYSPQLYGHVHRG